MGKLWRCNVVSGGLLVSGVLAGCVVENANPGERQGEARQQIGGSDPGFDEQPNGRSIVGAEFEKPKYVTSNPSEYFSVSVDGKPEPVGFTRGGSLEALSGNLTGIVLSSDA